MGEERRKSHRVGEKRYVAVKVLIVVRVHNGQVFSVLVDLSEDGCCLRSGVNLPRGSGLEAAIGFGEEIRTIPGVIRRSRRMPEGNWELGVEFTEVQPGDLSFLKQVIRACNPT